MFQVKDKQAFKDTTNIFLKAYDAEHLLPLLPTPKSIIPVQADRNWYKIFNKLVLSSFVSMSNCTHNNIYVQFCP